ncbi:TetR/AcrR family transcriptional regulator [Herbiconiux sp. CPCC 205763]|uniref:TetR/AcrR family transcriptional regulator n=1 Tax=Herbiconiux aconitum TaxID=2970913 RepID=A0ABT2GMC7_9MICO|nr:TetR/AcrR family transcriptional regulator [Herbiconiux aconitum]MCS5716747.1 TetR/AcrR family transcriptional regulator [Herbiconiux aconitum]
MSIRQEQKAETRAQIMAAAATEFAAHGYAGATFTSIAAAMGKPKSALGYHQFRSKQEIASAIVSQHYERWAAFRASVDRSVPAGLPRLLSFILTVALDARADPQGRAAIRLLLERGSSGVDIAEPPFRWRDLSTADVEDAVRLGQLPDGGASSAASVGGMILTAGLGLFEAENHGVQPVDTEAALRALWRALLAGAGATDAEGALAATRSVLE